MNNYFQQQPFYQQPRPMPQNCATILFVPTVPDILSVQVPQGQKVWVMAQSEPVFAVREADAFGIVQTKYCKFETYDPESAAKTQQGDYVTRAEFNVLVEKLKAIGGVTGESTVSAVTAGAGNNPGEHQVTV